jgi:hypothetical protein
VSPRCIQLLPSVISADLSSDAWTPTTVAGRVHLPVSSPVTSAFPEFPLGRLFHKNPFKTSERGVFSRLQSFDDLQASEFAVTQVVPTAGAESECQGSRGVYVRAERGSLPPRASDTLAVRMGIFLDLQPCWLLQEFHPRTLPEPCVTLSSRTAPDVRPLP